MAVGASGVVLASSFWNRRAAVWGHRPVLLISLAGAVAGLLGFALTARAGLAGAVSGTLLLALLLLTRGVVFGLAWAATPVTAQSSVADVTTGVAERVRGLSMAGAPQGLALAVGPAIGALLSGFGLLAPLNVAPVLLAGIAVVLWLGLPKPPALGRRHRRCGPVVLLRAGFLLQDLLHLSAQATGGATGLVMFAGAAMVVLVQALPRLGRPPVHLLRAGAGQVHRWP